MQLSLYVHWPYCISKCPYCDFNSHVGNTQDQSLWREAYVKELEAYAERLPNRRISSIFFGGGTPSLMEAQTVGTVLDTIKRLWPVESTCEITLEANPSSVEAQKFREFQAAGINRLSLGVQSLDNDALAFLGRAHDAADARQAIEIARQTFSRFSFDLIYARKDQTPEKWTSELKEALQLAGDHLSLYQLTIEPQTQFHTRTRRGETLTAVDAHSVRMFELTQDIMDQADMPAYEISNHARKGQESRHNLTYWLYRDYLGIGPGAHGRFLHDGVRNATENHKAPDTWLAKVKEAGFGIQTETLIDHQTSMQEAVMMGLRLRDGITLQDWKDKFEIDLTDYLSREKLKRLVQENYLVVDAHALRATRSGLQRLNAVLQYLAS